MKNDKRQESLATINTSSEVRLILISFKAGSTGEYGRYTWRPY
jgi:SNF2 family DNA or RNA helicase